MTDPSDCPQCGEWRDGPRSDCAACGYIQPAPCGDPSGRCIYVGPHDGPHKVAIRAGNASVEARVTVVCDLLWDHGVYMRDSTPLARAIVEALS